MEIVIKHPLSLLGLLLIPILIVLHYYFFHRNKLRAMKFANFSAMKRVTGTKLITKNTRQLILRCVIIVMFVLASAHPIVWYAGSTSLTDYSIIIDTSASMINEDVKPDRLTVAKQAANFFIDHLESQTKVSLVSFAGVSFVKSPLTDDLVGIKMGIDAIDVELTGGTDIAGALITATNLLMSSEKSKAIILFTDGSDTASVFVEDSIDTSLDYLLKNHVKVYTVGVGSGIGKASYIGTTELKPVYDKTTLSRISESTGGDFFEVKDSAEISAAMLQIVVDKEESLVPLDLLPGLLLLSAILLIFEWVILNLRFRPIP